MRLNSVLWATIGIHFCMACPAVATVGCSATSNEATVKTVKLFSDPNDTADVLREIPLGDIVMLPDEGLAPSNREGWVWVRHDISQQAIWQSGVYGWVMAETISDCG